MLIKFLVPNFSETLDQVARVKNEERQTKNSPLLVSKRRVVCASKSSSDSLHDFFELEYNDHKIVIPDHDYFGKYRGNVSEDFLKEIINNPGSYLDHQENLNWEWLIQKINIS